MGVVNCLVAHEIRNPLSTIEGYMEGLIDGVMPPSRETYEAVAREAHRLKRLTRDLSTLSKAQEGAIEYDLESLDLGAIARAVIETLEPQYEINEVALRVGIDETLPIKGDADRLAQALTNLLGNALAHTPPGGQVSVVGASRDGQCTLAITDTGPGVPPEVQERMLNPFYTTRKQGTGMGLSITRSIVEAHGGQFWINTEVSSGVSFHFTLPIGDDSLS